MTICNMSIEGGARVGYVNPDETTFDYLRGRPFAPQGDAFERAGRVVASRSRPTRTRATTTRSTIDAAAIAPTVTWGINPGQSVGVDERVPGRRRPPASARRSPKRSTFMGFQRGPADRRARRSTSRSSARAPTAGSPICAKPRASSAGQHVAPHVQGAGRAGLAGGARGGRARRARPRCSATPASSGAAPAARCAWR